jgi:outer membrane protein assembly factor BamB
MLCARASRLSSILLCGCAAAPLPACDEAAGEDEPRVGGGAIGAAIGAGPGAGETPAAGASCLDRAPGQGFASVPLSPAGTLSVIDLEATATTLQLDGVIGLSRGPAVRFDQLAAAVRFAPGGTLDARDGGGYRADAALPFQVNRMYPVRMVADIPSHTYSVYVQDPATTDVIRLAQGYAFRPSQASTTSLDALSAIVDGPAGQLSVCNARGAAPGAVVYSREGSYTVAPLPGDQALVSDGVATTWKLGAAGQVLGQIARGGEVAADETGNVYVALASGGQLALHAFTAQLAPRWSRVEPAEPAAEVQAIAADAAGVTIALATAQGVASIRRYPATGAAGGRIHGGGTLAALARDGFAIATAWQGGVSIAVHDRTGGLVWSRSFDNAVTAEVMTLDLDGRVVLGGHFSAAITFGGPTLEPAFNGEVDVNSYAVALARADGAHVFTTRIPTTRLTGAGAAAGRLVIAGETWVTPIFPHLWQLDPAGNLLPGEPYTGFAEQWGRSGRVAVGSSNRIYWERSMVWPSPVSPAFPYLLAIAP